MCLQLIDFLLVTTTKTDIDAGVSATIQDKEELGVEPSLGIRAI